MPRFRKKPVEIEAVQWEGMNRGAVRDFMGELDIDEADRVTITTLEGVMKADVGDWIIRGVQGEFYPCKPAIFDATYEPVDPDEAKLQRDVERVVEQLAPRPREDKRDALIHAGYGDASAILNVLHQAGWQITPGGPNAVYTAEAGGAGA